MRTLHVNLVPALGVRVIPKAQVTCLRQTGDKGPQTTRSTPPLHLHCCCLSLQALSMSPVDTHGPLCQS